MMAWVDALREYAKGKGKWHIPKKGTKEYNEVKMLQREGHVVEGEAPEAYIPKKRGRPAKPKAPAPPAEMKTTRKVQMTPEGGMKITLKSRKQRKDKGVPRGPSVQKIAEESVRLGLVKKSEAFGRKQRKDKGVKRGKRAPKVEAPSSLSEEFFYA